MYDELIEVLRFCETHATCRECVFCPKDAKDMRCNNLLTEAADAIEELQNELRRSKDFEAFWQHEAEEALKKFQVAISNKPRWIPVTEENNGEV